MTYTFRIAAIAFAFVLPVAVHAQSSIESVTPNALTAGVPGATLTISGELPTFPSGSNSVCFYTGYGASSTAIQPTSDTFTVPASSIQEIPPGSFTSGVFTASVYITDFGATCDGASHIDSNVQQVTISLPTITYMAASQLQQPNPALSITPPPSAIAFQGTGFIATTGVTFTWTGGSAAGTVYLTSAGFLNATLPAIPAGTTSLTASLCNITANYDYCAAPQAIPIEPLAASAGTLNASPNPTTINQPVTLSAQFAVNGSTVSPPGAPTGTVTFTSNGVTLGTAPLILDQAAGLLSPNYSASLESPPATVVRIADVNGDGLPDALFFDAYARLDVQLSSTPYGATQRSIIGEPDPSCPYITDFAIGDVNGDGHPDLVINCNPEDGSNNYTEISLGQGDGAFLPATVLSAAQGDHIALKDVTGDGILDLVVAGPLNNCSSSCVSTTGFAIFTGDGKGDFTLTTTIQTSSDPGSQLLAVDINNDGHADLVELNNSGLSSNATIDVYLNNGNGTSFGNKIESQYGPSGSIQLGPSTSGYSNLIAGDFNGDGFTDLAALMTGDPTYSVVYAYNTSASSGALFGVPGSFAVPPDTQFLSAADFNGDGLADIAVTGQSAVTVYDSTGTSFATDYAGLSITPPGGAINGIAVYDLNFDGDADVVIITAPTGMDNPPATFASYLTSGPSDATLNTAFAAAGTPELTASWPGNINFTGSTANTSLVVNGLPTSTVLSLLNTPSQYGQTVTFSATVSGSMATPTGSVSFYDGDFLLGSSPLVSGVANFSIATLTTGNHNISATYSGDSTNAPSDTGSSTQVVNQATPIITWTPTTSSIPYGTALSSAQLNATASTTYTSSVPGTFTYNPVAGTVLGVGGHDLAVTFTPTDTTDYSSVNGSTSINVTKATPTVSWTAPAAIGYGTALSATQLDATATGISGALAGTFTYTPPAGTVLNAGPNQALGVLFTPTDTTDYNTANGSTTITVTKATPSVSWTAPASISYGAALSATQLDATATGISGALAGTFSYTPAAGTVLGAGPNQALSVLFTPTDTTDYNTANGATTITVSKATPTVSWTAPAAIPYGTALSGTQLDATATGISGTLPGTFTYTPAAGKVLGAGANQALSVLFTPTDATDYNTATGATTITVNKATPTVTWTAPAAITYGTALSATQLDATATGIAGALPGSFVYTPATGTVLGAGPNQALSVLFTPTDATDYNTATGATTITVNKGTPSISWTTPAPIVYGTALSATQLDATSGGIPGAFIYTPPAGTLLTAGPNQPLSVSFTPTDAADYNTTTGATTLTVAKATPTVSWATPAAITYGTALSATQLDATATGIAGALPGAFVYTPAAGTVLGAGTQPLGVVFSPTDTTDYNTATGAASLVVGKATPVITWPAPAAIVYGTPLSSTQLDATAAGISGALAGTFVYSPAAGVIPPVGNNQPLNLTFTPTDVVDYATATASTTLSVIGLTLTTVTPTTANLGDSAKALTLTGVGFLANSVVQVNGTALATTYVSGTSLTAILPASNFLTVQTLSITVLDPTQNQTSAAVSFAVVAPTPAVVFTGPSTAQPAQQPVLNFTLTNPYPVPLTGTLTLTFSGTGGVDDPAIQFATGGRTSTVTIPANSTATPTIQIQSGTDAGAITITLTLSAGGQNVTPASVQPIVITVPPASPSITSSTLTRSGNTLTVSIIGFSNTRDLSEATFYFNAANGASIDNPDITVNVTPLFTTWFSSAASQTYGSEFLYTQTFDLSTDATDVGSVTVTLTNSVGASSTATAQ